MDPVCTVLLRTCHRRRDEYAGELIHGVHAERGPRNRGERHVNAFPPRPTPAFTWLGSDRLDPVLDGSSRDLLPGELSSVCFPDWVYLVPLFPSGKLPLEFKFKGFICSALPLAVFHLTHHYLFSGPRVCIKIFLPLCNFQLTQANPPTSSPLQDVRPYSPDRFIFPKRVFSSLQRASLRALCWRYSPSVDQTTENEDRPGTQGMSNRPVANSRANLCIGLQGMSS